VWSSLLVSGTPLISMADQIEMKGGTKSALIAGAPGSSAADEGITSLLSSINEMQLADSNAKKLHR
jgi:hypothetical protein